MHELSDGTHKQRRPIYNQMIEHAGDQLLTSITRHEVETGMSKRTDNLARHLGNRP